MSDAERTGYILYAITVACPICDEVTQFVKTAEEPVPLDRDVPFSVPHCPECGVHLRSVGEEWDLQAEHEIEAVAPTDPSRTETDR